MRRSIQFFFSLVGLITHLLLFSAESSYAQKNVSASLGKKEIRIGEQTSLKLSATVPPSSKVMFPSLKDSVAPSIEIVNAGPVDTLLANDGKLMSLSKVYTITAFDSGYFPVPAFRFIIDGDSSHETSADLLTVKTVPVDTAAAFKTIKPPLDAPWTLAEIYLEIAIAAGVILLLMALFIYWKKRKKTAPVLIVPEPQKIPAHIIAIEALNQLKEQQLWQKGNIKLYHVCLSEIARTYLQNRFGFHALEKTTDEISFSLSSINSDAPAANALIESLRISDLVKFAKATPMAGDHEFCWTAIFDFVSKTMEVIPHNKEVSHE